MSHAWPADVLHAYSSGRQGTPAGEPALVLLIGPEVTHVAFGTKAIPQDVLTLQTGDQRLVRELFGNAFPRALQLERAIAVVEDEVMKNWPLPAGVTRLIVVDPVLHDIALASGHVADPRIELDRIDLDLEAVERLFGRLAAVSHGSPASQQGLPNDAAFAARLLILREFLHHLRFQSVSIVGNSE